jgi:hypothetical protein
MQQSTTIARPLKISSYPDYYTTSLNEKNFDVVLLDLSLVFTKGNAHIIVIL